MSSVESKSSKRSRQSSIGQEVDLHVTNPELFKASPRPGGFLKIRVPPRGEDYDYNLYNNPNYDESEDCRCSSDPNICININKPENESIMLTYSKHGQNVKLPSLPRMSPGREFRLKRAVESTDWTIKGIDETDTMIEISNPIQDTLNMLAVTISTIMMMSAQVPDIEDVYLDWATQYLNCIVDENDEEFNRPPNVQGILNHILFLKMGGKVSGNDSSIQSKSPKGSPPSSMKKSIDNHSGGAGGSAAGGSAGGGSGTRGGSAGGGSGTKGGSAGGGSGTKGGSAGGGGGSAAGVGSNRPGSGAGSRQSSGKGVSISERSESGARGAGSTGRNNSTTPVTIKSR